MKRLANYIIYFLSLVLSPPQCTACKEFLAERVPLCDACEALILPIVSVKMYVNKQYTLTVHALANYQDPLRSLILSKNYGSRVGSSQLAQLIIKRLDSRVIAPCDYIIPIPLHWTRYAKRGFNQADIIATALAGAYNKKVVYGIQRHKKTLFQTALSAVQRKENITRAFSIRQSDTRNFAGKHLVIVDDLMTTGATLQAAAQELIKLKPASITAIVAARVV